MSSDNAKHFNPQAFQPIVSFIWSCADTLRDHYKKGEYPNIILPLAVIRRIDAVLEGSKAQVLATYEKYKDKDAQFLAPPRLTPLQRSLIRQAIFAPILKTTLIHLAKM